MRKKIMMIAVLLAVMAAMTGIANAFVEVDGYSCKEGDGSGNYKECLKASWDNVNNQIDVAAYNFETDSNKDFCYQIRYYQPNTWNPLKIYIDETPKTGETPPYYNDPNVAEGPFNNPENLDGFFVNPKFAGNNLLYQHLPDYTNFLGSPPATFSPNSKWDVVLMKNGTVNKEGECRNPSKLANSERVWVPVDITIPEFSTVAIPIAAVLGLVFFFQHRKKKEE